MRVMRTRFLFFQFILLHLFLSINLHGRNNDSIPWIDARKHIINGLEQYFLVNESKHHVFSKYDVIVIKIVQLQEERGEFSISDICMDQEYNMVNPSNYVYFKDKLILIETDSLRSLVTDKLKFSETTEQISKEAYAILAGPNMSITAQLSNYMVFHFKKNDLSWKYCTPIDKIDHKYLLRK